MERSKHSLKNPFLKILHGYRIPCAGVGSAGTTYSTNRWKEFAFVIRVLTAIKQLAGSEREQLLDDGWVLAK
ncbi:hypothetical protein [Desulfobacter hydrogenophilus]|uniref:Uncharacterized protein n=1 Tax=Desulfobacter hydrogenophilus TaxID=2291 RepID=A0ABX5RGA0_9BACT|nr:hypothetical protein [Desulfobacter hydrogenophilus]NDY73823.1 hypothetical protein [Desulfobacter hydrogenophilus]QBH13697.1 hypothetical protein EYB58_12655 [Desulfobacter hydrogenophilus]